MTKRLLSILAAAAAGFLMVKRAEAKKDERDLWAQATDPVAGPDQIKVIGEDR